MPDTTQRDARREKHATTHPEFSEKDVLSMLRAVTAPDYVLDRMWLLVRADRKAKESR